MSEQLPASIRDVFPFKNRFAHLSGGAKMHYVDEGEGDMILFLHDIPLWSFYFRNLIDDLRHNFRCLAPDYCGFGLSSKDVGRNYSLRTITDNVLELLKMLNVGRFNLVMHGWGGVPGMAVATRWPERIKRIAIFNANCFLEYRMPFLHSIYRYASLGHLAVNFLNLPARHAAHSAAIGSKSRAGYIYPYGTWSSRTPTRIFFENLPESKSCPIGRWMCEEAEKMGILSKKKCLAFWGVKDRVFPLTVVDRWKEYLEELKVHEFHSSGRFALEDDYDTILPLIRRFLMAGVEIKLPI
ncbi:MAG: alpha/beta fold hydrolase [Puniceicoccales bacterium]|jgi:haloalkane dehalogenase|nr:alpha/beta fold hydrolase [Puniceicoccales bacterium]